MRYSLFLSLTKNGTSIDFISDIKSISKVEARIGCTLLSKNKSSTTCYPTSRNDLNKNRRVQVTNFPVSSFSIFLQATVACKNFQINFSLYIRRATSNIILSNIGYKSVISKRIHILHVIHTHTIHERYIVQLYRVVHKSLAQFKIL